ncbi:helix-turn-helix domain-containing protein [Streptomyces sp. SBT349]|uniref:helix-turn-helix domain-containing protein n=1 Tax=Streptomyces sp. SBT349 TaxID=1580539 RepID=UPI00066E2B4F|nr:helix-turn-helix domain-containing protein [Streptomyces sp. SBT349]
MAPDHIAYGMRASYGMTHITANHIAAWERGTARPTANELAALAAALWCAPGDLMGRPRTLLEHRLARGIAAEDLARLIGLTLDAYRRMEETGHWTGDAIQTANLGSVLSLPPSDFIAITGLQDELARLLTEAVSTRWQAHIRAIAKLVSMERGELQEPLRTMHQEYQSLMAATLSRAGGTTASGEDGQRYIDNIVGHFWARLGED